MSTPTETRSHDARIGTRLGKYLITARLGRGGMGIVYAAFDTLLRRHVALKLLPESLSNDPVMLHRFVQEAQAAARLNHPHIVSIYEVDRAADAYYIAMELVRGGSVQEFLRRRTAFDWREATRIAADVCHGLAAAHAAGLIHRDIKPANVMLSREGTVKLADFGLAKFVGEEGLSHDTATLVGTPDYMSPEQCRCDELDERSDLYALGATYYAMLTGRPPFAADTPVQVMFAHCARPAPDPRDVEPEVPESCAVIVRRAMAKERNERYSSAAETAFALEAAIGEDRRPVESTEWGEFLESEPQPIDSMDDSAFRWLNDSQTRRRRKLRRKWAACFAVVLVALGCLVWRLSDQTNRETLDVAEQASTTHGTLQSADLSRRFSPEGTVLRLDSPGALLAVSADGRWLAVGGEEGDVGLKLWDLTTGELQPERRFRLPRGRPHQRLTALAFAPDGAWLAFAAVHDGAGDLSVWDMQHEARPPHRFDLGPVSVAGLAYSTDGVWLSATCNDATTGTASVRTWDRATWKEARPLQPGGFPANWLSYSATTPSTLAVAAGNSVTHWEIPNHRSLGLLERSVATTHGAFASQGDLLGVAAMNYVRLRHVDGIEPPRLWELPSGTAGCIAFTVDGAWCAVGGGTERGGLVTLYEVGGLQKPVVLRSHEARVRAVAFLPRGDIVVSTGDDRTVRFNNVRGTIIADAEVPQ